MFQIGYLDCTWTQEPKMYNLKNNKIEKQQNHKVWWNEQQQQNLKAPMPKHTTTMTKNNVIKRIWTIWIFFKNRHWQVSNNNFKHTYKTNYTSEQEEKTQTLIDKWATITSKSPAR